MQGRLVAVWCSATDDSHCTCIQHFPRVQTGKYILGQLQYMVDNFIRNQNSALTNGFRQRCCIQGINDASAGILNESVASALRSSHHDGLFYRHNKIQEVCRIFSCIGSNGHYLPVDICFLIICSLNGFSSIDEVLLYQVLAQNTANAFSLEVSNFQHFWPCFNDGIGRYAVIWPISNGSTSSESIGHRQLLSPSWWYPFHGHEDHCCQHRPALNATTCLQEGCRNQHPAHLEFVDLVQICFSRILVYNQPVACSLSSGSLLAGVGQHLNSDFKCCSLP